MSADSSFDGLKLEERIKTLAATDRRAAYALMAKCYLPSLARHVDKVVRNSEDANDIAVDVILRAMEEPRLLDDEFHIKAWLYRASFNRALNAVRDRKRRAEVLARRGAALAPPEPPDSEDRQAADELTPTVERLLRRLTSDHSAIIRLRYYEDLEYKEIADRLDVPIGTVMSRLSRAHESVRDHVLSEGLSEELRSFL